MKHDQRSSAAAFAGAAIDPVTDRVTDAFLEQLRSGLKSAQQGLLRHRVDASHWVGRLASSSLSSATAISALATFVGNSTHPSTQEAQDRIRRGLVWLDRSQNDDGGFGDTDRSPSNIASSYLGLAAWRIADRFDSIDRSESIERLVRYIDRCGGRDALTRRYGTDKTFVVPILSNCAIAGLVPWSDVASLPFELAAFPQWLYRFLQMPVVSYAIPALVAIGQSRFHHAGTRNPVAYLARRATRRRTLTVLRAMQPNSGGYLEATPLTSFVLMNLASMNLADHEVSLASVRFLFSSQLPDGSWPIDEDLATWLTSLSIGALSKDPSASLASAPEMIDWLLDCQHTLRHPFTGADPGGWGWTSLSGAVPDADDTPAAMLALIACLQQDSLQQDSLEEGLLENDSLGPVRRQRMVVALDAGAQWLLGLQNRDGGWPTFCRGWGKLPFDRSGSDLTAHAIRALHALRQIRPSSVSIENAIQKGIRFLLRTQRDDGSWLPLWFGNHDLPDDENPIYGTARVLLALENLKPQTSEAYRRGCEFLLNNQNDDGGWGGGASVAQWLASQRLPSICQHNGQPIRSSVEETAVAVEALAGSGCAEHRASIIDGTRFLLDAIESGRCQHPWPIGFYFAKLWYHEHLYPWVFSSAALARAAQALKP